MGGETVKHTMITYAEAIYNATVNTDCGGMYLNEATDRLAQMMRGNARVFLAGNGGSGACCDHMANDLCLANVNAMSLSNSNNITCAANDFGFERIFTKQLEWWANNSENNLLVVFSCSGESKNIIDAVRYVRTISHFDVVTFSGKQPTNTLRNMGNLNFYVPSQSYGVVQLAHEALIHCAIDKIAGLA